jgi:hypothetical protein
VINSFFIIFPTQNAAVRWEEHILSSENVAGAQPKEKPEDDLVLFFGCHPVSFNLLSEDAL